MSRRPGKHQVRQRREFVRRQAQHPLHDIDAVDAFRHAVLDLQPRVHFEEVETPGCGVIQKLDRARHAIRHAGKEGARLLVHFFAHRG